VFTARYELNTNIIKVNPILMVVPWFRRLVAVHPPRRPRLCPGQVRVGLVTTKSKWDSYSLGVRRFSPTRFFYQKGKCAQKNTMLFGNLEALDRKVLSVGFYVCMELRTKSDHFPVQHQPTGFYNP
jgi:hypothetical protein